MNFEEYKKRALALAIYPQRGDNLQYTALGLLGEAGEFADKLKKQIRDRIEDTDGLLLEMGDVLWYVVACADEAGLSLNIDTTEPLPTGVSLEDCALLIGYMTGRVALDVFESDVCMHTHSRLHGVIRGLRAAAHALGSTLEEVAAMNIDKLESRAERGVLGGSGDTR